MEKPNIYYVVLQSSHGHATLEAAIASAQKKIEDKQRYFPLGSPPVKLYILQPIAMVESANPPPPPIKVTEFVSS
jgi:hypothetical protein